MSINVTAEEMSMGEMKDITAIQTSSSTSEWIYLIWGASECLHAGPDGSFHVSMIDETNWCREMGS